MGQAVTLVAALSYTLGVIYGRLRPQITPRLQAAGQNLGGALFLVPLSLTIDAPWTLAPGAGALWALLGMGVLSTAIPALLLFRLVRTVGATNASLATFFMPVAAVIVNGRVRIFSRAEAAG